MVWQPVQGVVTWRHDNLAIPGYMHDISCMALHFKQGHKGWEVAAYVSV